MNMFLAVHNQNSAVSSETNVVIKSRAILKQFAKTKYPDKECRHNIRSHVFRIFYLTCDLARQKRNVERRETIWFQVSQCFHCSFERLKH